MLYLGSLLTLSKSLHPCPELFRPFNRCQMGPTAPLLPPAWRIATPKVLLSPRLQKPHCHVA